MQIDKFFLGIFFAAIMSSSALANQDADVKELFQKYEKIMLLHETELIEEVFSPTFIKDHGGVKALASTVKSSPKASQKKLNEMSVSWKKGALTDLILARRIENKNGKKESGHTEFVVIKKDGKLVIDDTVGDAD
jgi:hypothetical protein